MRIRWVGGFLSEFRLNQAVDWNNQRRGYSSLEAVFGSVRGMIGCGSSGFYEGGG